MYLPNSLFVGVNKHFQMACIHNKLNECVTAKKITSKDVWTHLGEMYDLSALVSDLFISLFLMVI